jgi:hypothetical protein
MMRRFRDLEADYRKVKDQNTLQKLRIRELKE